MATVPDPQAVRDQLKVVATGLHQVDAVESNRQFFSD